MTKDTDPDAMTVRKELWYAYSRVALNFPASMMARDDSDEAGAAHEIVEDLLAETKDLFDIVDEMVRGGCTLTDILSCDIAQVRDAAVQALKSVYPDALPALQRGTARRTLRGA
jgi:hypothetical protein